MRVISEPDFYCDLVNKFKKHIGRIFFFSLEKKSLYTTNG